MLLLDPPVTGVGYADSCAGWSVRCGRRFRVWHVSLFYEFSAGGPLFGGRLEDFQIISDDGPSVWSLIGFPSGPPEKVRIVLEG